jgi:PhnB protein
VSDEPTTTYPAIVPMISYEDGPAAIEWLERAFGFRERRGRRIMEGDRLTHAELAYGDGLIMLATPTSAYESPRHHRESCSTADRWLKAPWVIDGALVHVDDVLAHRARALEAGATMLSEIEDTPVGRLYRVEDVEGHRWMFLEPPR